VSEWRHRDVISRVPACSRGHSTSRNAAAAAENSRRFLRDPFTADPVKALQSARMSKIKTAWLDQYGAERFR